MKGLFKISTCRINQPSSRNFQSLLQVAWWQAQCRELNKFTHTSGKDTGCTLKWGIAPVTLMAEDFATALSVLPRQTHKITSCVNPYRSRALKFADKHNVSNVYTSFEDLARCPDVDAVYISPVNPMHYELCHLMLNHDKHVLCEQPLCMAEPQVVELIAKARARGLFLLEGFWPRFTPAYYHLCKEMQLNKLGKIYSMECTLGWCLPLVQAKQALYGGVSKDLGPYGIQLALWVFRDVPRYIKVTAKMVNGIDVATNIELSFTGNRTARLELSAEQKYMNTAIIHGTKGSVALNNVWCPTLLKFDRENYEFVLPETKQPTFFNNRIGLCYEVHEMRNCILTGRIESEYFNHNESRLMSNLTNQVHQMLDIDLLQTEMDKETLLQPVSCSPELRLGDVI